MSDWHFVPRKFLRPWNGNVYDELCAPAVDVMGGWDPDFFTDEDGRLYMYNGSSNRYLLYGIELDRRSMDPLGTRKELFMLDPWRCGWQRFGEHMDNTFLDPFMEGAHITKHNGKYFTGM